MAQPCVDCDAQSVDGIRCFDCSAEVEETPRWRGRDKECLTCRIVFTPSRRTQNFCSEKCRVAGRIARSAARSCERCSADFQPIYRNQRFCGLACASTGRFKYAATCSEANCGKKHYCKGLCRTHYNRKYFPDSQKRWPGDLEARRKALRAKTQRRRAATKGVLVENVDRDVVGERDSWRCGVCRRKISRVLVYPHPRSASLDHVIPLSHGGEHSYVNTRITHLECNTRRSNRGGGEQLALIG